MGRPQPRIRFVLCLFDSLLIFQQDEGLVGVLMVGRYKVIVCVGGCTHAGQQRGEAVAE